MVNENEIKEQLERKASLQAQIEKKEDEKKALFEANKEKLEERAAHQKRADSFQMIGIWCAIIGVIGLLFFGNMVLKILLAVVGIGGCVGMFILRSKPMAAVKTLSVDLTDCDKTEAQINTAIAQMEESVSAIIKKQKLFEIEKKYGTGHICIYMGESFDPNSKSPKESAYVYSEPGQVTVYIDGIEYGTTRKPFGAFEVTPGTHVVKIAAQTMFGGKDGILYSVESNARQVKVTDGSVYMFYHWSFYAPSRGIGHDLILKTYDNMYDFLSDTHNLND